MEIRDGNYGSALIAVAKNIETIVALDVDYSTITGSNKFGEIYPNRFFNVGIAEQNMVSVAEGMALTGLIPFVSAASSFIVRQAYDQIFNTAFSKAPVKFVGHSAGCSLSREGVCLQSYDDIALVRIIPGVPILAPATREDVLSALVAAANHDGPVYIRIPMPDSFPDIQTVGEYEIGKAMVYRTGIDAAILTIGPILGEAMAAAESLQRDGIDVMVVDMRCLNPVDTDIISKAASTGRIVTVEEHMTDGGLGGCVAEHIVNENHCTLQRLGLKDTFSETAPTYRELWQKFAIDSASIAKAIKNFSSKDRT